MSLLLATLVVVVFSVLLQRMHVASHAREATQQASRTASLIRDPLLTDRDKERELRRNAGRLFRLSAAIAGLCLLALILPLAGVLGLDRLGWVSGTEVLAILQRLDFLAGATVVGTASYYVSLMLSRR